MKSEDEVQRNAAVWEQVRAKIEAAKFATDDDEVADTIGRVALLASVELVDPTPRILRSIADAVERVADMVGVRREWAAVSYELRRGADWLQATKAAGFARRGHEYR